MITIKIFKNSKAVLFNFCINSFISDSKILFCCDALSRTCCICNTET